MPTIDDTLTEWMELFALFQKFTSFRRGLIGDGNGTVHVATKVGWDWIRYNDDISKLSQVRNPFLYNFADGTPVIVGKYHPSEEYERVLYVDLSMHGDSLDDLDLIYYSTAPHGINHHALLGSDPAWIDTANLVPGRMRPTDPVSMSVYVEPFYYPNGMTLVWFTGNAIDLTAHVPAGAGHLYVLVYLDIDDGVLASIEGPVVPLAAAPDIPDLPESGVPLGMVDLRNGQTVIQDRYWQFKALWGTVGGDVPTHTHSSDTEGGTSIVGLEEFMFACAEPLYLDGNAIWPVNAYHSLYLTGQYIIGLDAHADLVWIHPDPLWGCGQHLIIRPASPTMYTTYSITVRHGVGNIWFRNERDRTLSSPQHHLHLIYDGEYWCDFEGQCCDPAVDAQYVVMVADAELINERVLTAGTGILLTDGGAGGAATVAVDETLYLRLDATNDPVTAGLEINAATTDEPVLILRTTDDNAANPILLLQDLGGNTQVSIAVNGGAVFNEEQNDADFRVESANKTNMLLVDGGFDSVLVNTAADLASTFGVQTTSAGDIGIVVRASAAQTANLLELQDSAGNVLSGVDERGILFSDGGTNPFNVFLGSDAGNTTMTGQQNMAIGPLSFVNITTGNRNAAIGVQAGYNITTGQDNICIGNIANYYNKTGSSNVAIGHAALYGVLNISTFGHTVGIGESAGHGLTTGLRGVYIGAYSGYSVTGGHGNVFLGYSAGYAKTTGNYSIFIGTFAGSRQTILSNLLIVDNQQRADIATEITNSILYGVMAVAPVNQTLRINALTGVNITPTAQFHVEVSAAATIGLIVKGAAAQTANLLELQESDGSIMLASGDGLGGSVFAGNVQLEDIDFVWASDNEANLFRVDAALDEVRMGDWDTNYAAFEVDGTLRFEGTATVWDDLYFPMSSGKLGGANLPTWAAFQGNTFEYTFAINDYIHLPSGEIIHKYKEGSDIELHVHIVLDGSDVGDTYVNYELEYTIGDMGEVMSAAAVVTSGDTLITGGTADRTHIYVAIDTIVGAGYKIGASLKMRFRRIALVGGGLNAPSSDPFVTMVGAHIEEDTVGSRTELAK